MYFLQIKILMLDRKKILNEKIQVNSSGFNNRLQHI